jgi:replicative DNA helicase
MSEKLHDIVTEMLLLGCALDTPDDEIRAKILAETTPDDYGTPFGTEIRARMETLKQWGKPLGHALEFSADPALSTGASSAIRGTAQKRVTCASLGMDRVDTLLSTLKRYRSMRFLAQSVVDLAQSISGPVDESRIEVAASILDRTLNQIRNPNVTNTIHMGNGQAKEPAYKLYQDSIMYREQTFVSTGLDSLDECMHGFERGYLVTLSAPSGAGKSLLALQMGVNQYLEHHLNVLYVSMEMSEIEIYRRVWAHLSGVPHDQVRFTKNLSSSNRGRLDAAFERFYSHGTDPAHPCRFRVMDVHDPTFTPVKLDAQITSMGYDVVIVDYITLFHIGRLTRVEMQLEYSRYLKSMAKRLNCVVILLTQLSDDEKIKYGRGILENSDCWIHWRWDVDHDPSTALRTVELDLEKNRSSQTKKVLAYFDLAAMTVKSPGNLYAPVRDGAAVSPDDDRWSRIEAATW